MLDTPFGGVAFRSTTGWLSVGLRSSGKSPGARPVSGQWVREVAAFQASASARSSVTMPDLASA